MFILSELVSSLASLVSLLFTIVYFILIIRIILSWVSPDPYNEIVRIIYRISDPILAPFRRLPLQIGGIDFSPIIAFIVLRIASDFIVRVLYRIAARWG